MQIFFTKIHRTAKITFWCTLNLKVSQQTGKKDQIVKFKQKTSLIYSTEKSECTLLKKNLLNKTNLQFKEKQYCE